MEDLGAFSLKGFARPIPAYNVLQLKSDAPAALAQSGQGVER